MTHAVGPVGYLQGAQGALVPVIQAAATGRGSAMPKARPQRSILEHAKAVRACGTAEALPGVNLAGCPAVPSCGSAGCPRCDPRRRLIAVRRYAGLYRAPRDRWWMVTFTARRRLKTRGQVQRWIAELRDAIGACSRRYDWSAYAAHLEATVKIRETSGEALTLDVRSVLQLGGRRAPKSGTVPPIHLHAHVLVTAPAWDWADMHAYLAERGAVEDVHMRADRPVAAAGAKWEPRPRTALEIRRDAHFRHSMPGGYRHLAVGRGLNVAKADDLAADRLARYLATYVSKAPMGDGVVDEATAAGLWRFWTGRSRTRWTGGRWYGARAVVSRPTPVLTRNEHDLDLGAPGREQVGENDVRYPFPVPLAILAGPSWLKRYAPPAALGEPNPDRTGTSNLVPKTQVAEPRAKASFQDEALRRFEVTQTGPRTCVTLRSRKGTTRSAQRYGAIYAEVAGDGCYLVDSFGLSLRPDSDAGPTASLVGKLVDSSGSPMFDALGRRAPVPGATAGRGGTRVFDAYNRKSPPHPSYASARWAQSLFVPPKPIAQEIDADIPF